MTNYTIFENFMEWFTVCGKNFGEKILQISNTVYDTWNKKGVDVVLKKINLLQMFCYVKLLMTSVTQIASKLPVKQ